MIEGLKKFNLESYKDFLFSLIGAVLLFLASPPYDIFFLSYIAILIPLLNVKTKTNFFKKGFLFGLFYYILTMYWISYVLKTYGDIPFIIAISLMILLCMYLAIYYGIFFKLFFVLKEKLPVLVFPLVTSLSFVLLEFIRANILTGFPWMLLGYTQHKFTKLIQISDIFGVYGVSFVVIFSNISIWIFFTYGNKQSFFNILLAILFILSSVIYGSIRIKKVVENQKDKKSFTVSVIQGNIDQSQKWEKSLQKNILAKHIKLTEKELINKPQLVVWPETALPFIYGSDIELTEYLKDYLKDKNFYLYTGFPHIDFGEDGKLYVTNSAGIFYKGELLEKYNKTHLVPFGEYVPLKKLLFFVDKLVTAAGDFLAGKELKILSFDDLKIGSLICYEAIFPEISKEYKIKGANILINVTNDAWFGKTSAPYQHFAMSKFRAIENNLFLIRSANTGISGIISPTGEVLISTPLFNDYSFTLKILY